MRALSKVLVLAAWSLALLTTPARASSPGEAALAEELFRSAKEQMEAGNFQAACPMLAESQKHDPGGGTLLTLALCYEGEGRTASAWAEFNEAVAWAKREGRVDREAIARSHAEALRPRLTRLRIHMSDAVRATEGLLVSLDGVTLGQPSWDFPTPIDPGEHVVLLQAPGHATQRIVAKTGEPGTTVEVSATPLVSLFTPTPSPPEPTAPPSAQPKATPFTESRSPALLAFGIGASALALGFGAFGTGYALDARASWKDATTLCPNPTCSDRSGIARSEHAGSAADAATVLFVGASVAAVGGAALLLTYFLTPQTRTGSARAHRMPSPTFSF